MADYYLVPLRVVLLVVTSISKMSCCLCKVPRLPIVLPGSTVLPGTWYCNRVDY